MGKVCGCNLDKSGYNKGQTMKRRSTDKTLFRELAVGASHKEECLERVLELHCRLRGNVVNSR